MCAGRIVAPAPSTLFFSFYYYRRFLNLSRFHLIFTSFHYYLRTHLHLRVECDVCRMSVEAEETSRQFPEKFGRPDRSFRLTPNGPGDVLEVCLCVIVRAVMWSSDVLCLSCGTIGKFYCSVS